MKPLLIQLCGVLCLHGIICAQPMSGTFTVGGSSPDFVTLQDAADALKARGVSGPVVVNIRPGIYSRDGGATRLMSIDSVIVGGSPANRVTFQPDEATGGNPANVVLRVDFNVNTPNNEREIVLIGADNVTIRNLTFEDADSMDTPARFLVRVAEFISSNPTVEGLAIAGCTFRGTRFYSQGQQFGTDFGVYAPGGLITATVMNNRFSNLLRAASFNIDSDPMGDSLVAVGNRFDHLYAGRTGSGNNLGAAMETRTFRVQMSQNFVSNSSGAIALNIILPRTVVIERNYIQGGFLNQLSVRTDAQHPTDSAIVTNNVIIGSSGQNGGSMQVLTGRALVFHNTIIHAGGFGTTGLQVGGDSCVVLNNILLAYNGTVAFYQNGATNLICDHNLYFSTSTFFAQATNGQLFATFDGYRAATHLDSNSVFKDVAFLSDSLGIHLDECQSQEPGLNGIPLSRVPVDFYGARRDSVKPFVGAVEGVRLPYNMLAAPFKVALPGFAFSLASGKFESPTADGLAVPDYDNRQVLLFHNNGASRTFTRTGSVFTGFRPTVVALYDLDDDTRLDLIVAGDTIAGSLNVFWGNGSGGFSSPTTVQTSGRVRSIEGGPRFVGGVATIVTSEDNSFVPNSSFIGYTMHLGGRQLCHDLQRTGSNSVPDTIHAAVVDFALARVDAGGTMPAVVAPALFGSSNLIPKFLVCDVLPIAAGFCGTPGILFQSQDHEYQFPSTGIYSAASSIVAGDFDGDSDNDFITTGFSDDYCVFIRNQGNLTLTADTISTTAARGLVAFDYENDGDLDFVTVNRTLDSLGVTIFLNDGTGHFTEKRNCHFPFASGTPFGIVGSDFDLDGKKDVAIVSRGLGGADSLFVLYNLGGFNSTTEVRQNPTSDIPEGFILFQNYPNPFNPSTRIEYSLPAQTHVTIKIYNILGQEVASLVDEQQPNGNHVAEWNGKSTNGFTVSSGVYFYRIEAREPGGQFVFASVKKMVLLK